MEFIIKTASPQQTKKIGSCLGGLMRPGDVLVLAGDVGAGKTTFVQGLAEGLGVKAMVTSPTFTIIHEHQGYLPFYHIDAYRLENPLEIDNLGLEEYIYGEGVTAVEWPENIAQWLPRDYLRIRINKIDNRENRRQLTIDEEGSGTYDGLLGELKRKCEF